MAKRLFHILLIEDEDQYSPAQIRELLKEAERQGHPLDAGSYLEEMSVRQLDALVHGRTDA
jgi:hypothetical protein